MRMCTCVRWRVCVCVCVCVRCRDECMFDSDVRVLQSLDV